MHDSYSWKSDEEVRKGVHQVVLPVLHVPCPICFILEGSDLEGKHITMVREIITKMFSVF